MSDPNVSGAGEAAAAHDDQVTAPEEAPAAELNDTLASVEAVETSVAPDDSSPAADHGDSSPDPAQGEDETVLVTDTPADEAAEAIETRAVDDREGDTAARERPEPVADEVLLEAHDLARAALLEITPESTIGDPVGHVVEEDRVLSLLFANTLEGYPGWHWTVTLARVGEADPTVLEVHLAPGDGALLAPDWVPWSERLAEYRASQEAAEAEAKELADATAAAGGDDDLDDVESDGDDEDEDDEDADEYESASLLHSGDLDGVDVDELDTGAEPDESEEDESDEDGDTWEHDDDSSSVGDDESAAPGEIDPDGDGSAT